MPKYRTKVDVTASRPSALNTADEMLTIRCEVSSAALLDVGAEAIASYWHQSFHAALAKIERAIKEGRSWE